MSDLLQQIETLRARMHEAHEAVADRLKISQELDELINRYMRSVSHAGREGVG